MGISIAEPNIIIVFAELAGVNPKDIQETEFSN
jgi:hypothetical protein